MHKLIVREDIVKAFHRKPEICLQVYIDDYFDRILRSLQGCNITPIFVFDGKKHPLKEETNQERLKNRQHAERELDDLLQNPLEVDIFPDLIKWMKKAVFVREDIVACSLDWAVRNNVTCIGAPFEADWQLRQLEIDGIIDAILTIDGDLIALGCW